MRTVQPPSSALVYTAACGAQPASALLRDAHGQPLLDMHVFFEGLSVRDRTACRAWKPSLQGLCCAAQAQTAGPTLPGMHAAGRCHSCERRCDTAPLCPQVNWGPFSGKYLSTAVGTARSYIQVTRTLHPDGGEGGAHACDACGAYLPRAKTPTTFYDPSCCGG